MMTPLRCIVSIGSAQSYELRNGYNVNVGLCCCSRGKTETDPSILRRNPNPEVRLDELYGVTDNSQRIIATMRGTKGESLAAHR